MGIFKRCDRCGKYLSPGQKCGCISSKRNREYDRNGRDAERHAFYKSAAWTDMRQLIMSMDGGIDQWLLHTKGVFVAATLVHHIEPLADCKARALDPHNLVALSDSSHQEIHRLYEKDAATRAQTQRILFDLAREHTYRGY